MADPTQYSHSSSAESSRLSTSLLPLDLGMDYSLGYPDYSRSNSVFTTETNDNEDMQEVLDALLDLHSLQNTDTARFETDNATILKAINLNEKLQRKAQDHIRLVEEQLETNSKLLKEARSSTLEENRCGNKFPIHTVYRGPVSYFEDEELLNPLSAMMADSENQSEQGLDDEEEEEDDDDDDDDDDDNDDDDDDGEEEEDEEDEQDEQAMSSTDNEHNRSHKAWSRTERARLEEGIISEAKRMFSFDFAKKKEEWRIWQVDEIDKKELLMFPVNRFEWNRISHIYVLTRSPTECLIQWTTQEHPTINKKPWSKQESQTLSQMVNEIGLFSGQWERIAHELGTNRTISQCFSHYMFEKNNTHARRLKWSKEEDKKLSDAIKLFGNCNWQQVANILGERTGQQCLHRWQKSLNPAIKRQRWDNEEDALLERAVHLYGAGNWTKIQRLIPGRTDMQCRERWVNILQPSVNRSQFTQEETDHLVELVQQHGPKWSFLQSLMPGRTDNALMRQYKAAEKAKARADKGEAPKAKQQKKQKKQAKQTKATGRSSSKKRPRAKEGVDDGIQETQAVMNKLPKTNTEIPLRRSTRPRNKTITYNNIEDE